MTVESDLGALKAQVDRLEREVEQLEQENREVRALINKGWGAVAVVGFIGTGVAFLLTQLDRFGAAVK